MSFQSAIEHFSQAWLEGGNNQDDAGDSESSGNENDEKVPSNAIDGMVQCASSPQASSQPMIEVPNVQVLVGQGRSIPIRCEVRQSESIIGAIVLSESTVLMRDTFAVLPNNLPFGEIVRGALVKLGFSAEDAVGAKGFIQIKNWKPLLFSSVVDNPDTTIEEIFGEISASVTIIICLSRVNLDDVVWTDEAVRSAVFMLLKEVSQTALSKMSPLPQSMISNIINAKYTAKISASTCTEFGRWYTLYRREHEEPHIGPSTQSNSRQTFHSTFELPLMRAWYQQYGPSPSDAQLEVFLAELNSSAHRHERGAISLPRLKMWWKNEKQRCDRRLTMGQPPRERRQRRRKSAPPTALTGGIGLDSSEEDPSRGILRRETIDGGRVERADKDEAGELHSPLMQPIRKRRRRKNKAEAGTPVSGNPGWSPTDHVPTPAEIKYATTANFAGGFGLHAGAPLGFDLRNGLPGFSDRRNETFSVRSNGTNSEVDRKSQRNDGNDLRCSGASSGVMDAVQRVRAVGGMDMLHQRVGEMLDMGSNRTGVNDGSAAHCSTEMGSVGGSTVQQQAAAYGCLPSTSLSMFDMALVRGLYSQQPGSVVGGLVGIHHPPQQRNHHQEPAQSPAPSSHRQVAPLSLVRTSWN